MHLSSITTTKRLKLLSFSSIKLLGFFLSAIGLPIFLLLFPPSPEFTRRFYELGLETALFLVLISFVFLSRRGTFWVWIGLVFTLVLFTLSLIYKWQGLGSNFFLIGGLLPWSDSYGYYDEAQRLLHGLNLTIWGARRPFFPAFLSVLLAVTNNNLQLVLVVFVFLNAFAVYLAVREIQISLKSSIAPAVYLVISFLFYRRFAGTFMTENLGFLLGNLALVFLLQGVRENKIKKLFFGLFILTVGLNARAGAFFILPAFAIWMAYFLRQKFIWWRILTGAVCVIFLGMASNLLLLKIIGPTEGAVPFSNFSYTFYGLATGNTGWDQVLSDYPNIKEEDVPALAAQKFKENPYMLVIGITRAYQDFFTSSRGIFSFLSIRRSQMDFVNSLFWGLTVIGLIFAFVKTRRQPYFGLALAGFLGILISVSLLPPRDSDLMRVYAATIPITVYLISLGISVPGLIYTNHIRGQELEVENKNAFSIHSFTLPLSMILLFALFIGTPLVKQLGHLPGINNKLLCQPGQEQLEFLMGSGSSVGIESDVIVKESYVPTLKISDFRSKSAGHESELSNALLSLEPGSVLNLGIRVDDSTGETNLRSTFLVWPGILEPGYYRLCVIGSESQLLQIYPFFHSSLESMPNQQSVSRLTEINIDNLRSWYSLGLLMLFVLLMLDLVQIWKHPIRTTPLLLGNTLLMSVGILVLLHSLGWVPIQWERIHLDLERAKYIRGFSYRIDLEDTWTSKARTWNYPVMLYENDMRLDGPDQTRSFIVSEGAGSFTIIDGVLYFSSSDNSNPRTNGRQYQIVQPTYVRKRYLWISFLLVFFSVFFHMRYIKRALQSSDA